MSSFNNVVLLGNLTRDPELRYTPQGVPLCSFVVAVNHRGESEQKKTVMFVDVQAWRRLAEVCTQSLKKGCQVLVLGELEQERCVDTSTKKHRAKLLIVAHEVMFLAAKGHALEEPATEEVTTEP